MIFGRKVRNVNLEHPMENGNLMGEALSSSHQLENQIAKSILLKNLGFLNKIHAYTLLGRLNNFSKRIH